MKKRGVMLLCNTIMIAYAMSMTVASPLLSDIAASFSLSLSQSGFVFSSNFAGFVVFIFAGGVLADRMGKKKVLSFSLAGISAALLLMPFSPNFYVVCVLLFLIGGFSGIIESIISAAVSDLNPQNPTFYVNLSQVFFGLGALAGPIIAGFAAAGGATWRQCYLALGIVFTLLSAIFLSDRTAYGNEREAASAHAVKALLSDRNFLLICFCMFLYSGSEVGSWGWMATFLKEEAGFSVRASAIAVGVFWAAIIAGRLVCGPLTYKLEERRVILVLALFSACAVFLSGWMSGAWMIWLVVAGMGVGYSSLWPLIVSYGGKMHRESSGTAFAMLVGSCGLGMMVIPYLLGIVGELAGLRVAMMCPAILLAAIWLVFLFQRRPAEREDKVPFLGENS